VCGLLGWLFLVLMHLIPINNKSAIANESFLRQDVLMQQFDKESYIYLLVIIVFIGVFVMTATTSMILAYMRHICAMLKITR